MLTWVDLVVLVVGGWGAFKGARTGAVRQVVGVVGLFVAIAFAAALKDAAGTMLAGSFHLSPRVAPLAGFGVVLLALLLVFGILSRAMEAILDKAKLGFVNRLGGGALGAVRSLLVVSALLVPLRALDVPGETTRQTSPFYAPVAALLPWVWDHTGGLVRDGWRLREQIDALVNRAHRPDTTATPTAPPPPSAPPSTRRPAPTREVR